MMMIMMMMMMMIMMMMMMMMMMIIIISGSSPLAETGREAAFNLQTFCTFSISNLANSLLLFLMECNFRDKSH